MKAVTREERRVVNPPALIFCLLAAGIVTAAIGLLALLGWILKLPLLASFGAGLVPMAPSTAVLLLLYGPAISLRARPILSPRAFQASVALIGLGTMAALLLFTLGCLNIHWENEHIGLNITHTAGEAPLGHMSPVTAFCFMLASLSFFGSLFASALQPWRIALAVGAAGLLVGIGCIFLLAYIFGAPLLYGGAFIPPALNSVLIFGLLGLALLALAVRAATLSGGWSWEGCKIAFASNLIFALLAAGIVTGGYRYYLNYEWRFRAEAGRQLSAIAKLKVEELTQYRKERLWDAESFFHNAAFSGLSRRFLEHSENTAAQQQLEEWTAKYLVTRQYDLVCLFDTQGVVRLSLPAGSPVDPLISQRVPEVLRSGQVTFQDFYRNEQSHRVCLALLVPIFDESDANQPLGVFVLRIDPQTYLYPNLLQWPTPSLPSKTILVRREGNDALCLNELQPRTNTALNLRFSLANTNAVAVKAVLGQEGVVEGRDYFGAPVLAAVYAIPNSPWFLVTRLDAAKVYAPLRDRLRLTLLIVGLLLISGGLSVGAFWRQRRIQFYRERARAAEALARSETKFRTLYDATSDAVMLLNEKNFLDCNLATLTMFGCASREEFCSKHPADVSPPTQPDGSDSRTLANQRIATALEKGTNHFEWVHQRNGAAETFSAEVLLTAMKLDGKPVLQAVVRDITARQRVEEELRNSKSLYCSLVENLPQSVFRKDRDGRFQFVNEQFCWGLKRSQEDIIGRTDADFFPAELAQAYRKDDLRVMETGKVLDQEEKHIGADGQELFLQIIKSPLRDAQGQITGVQGVFWDITARKRTENELRRVNRAMRTVSECNQAMVRARDEATLLADMCRLLVEHGGYRMSWIGLAEQDEAKSVRPAAKGGYDVGYLDAVNVTWADTERGRGPTGTAIRTGQPVIVRNILTDSAFEPWRQAAIQHGYAATAALPLKRDDRVLGALVVYSAEPDTFNPGEMELLTELAGDIAYGMVNLRMRAEREQAEAAVRASETRYRRLFEAARDGILVLDAETGKVVDVNPFLTELLGIPQPEILGKTVWELGFFKEVVADQAGFEKLQKQEYTRHEDLSLQTSKGRRVQVEFVSNVYLVNQRQVIQCNLRDITERKLAEEKLHQEQTLTTTLMDNLPDAIYFKDANSRFLRVNRAMSRKFGLSDPAQIVGQSDADFFSGEHARKAAAAEQKILQTGRPLLNVEEKETWLDGTVSWVVTSKLPLRDATGRIVGTCGISRDITGRKQMEQALRESKALYHSLVEQMPAGVFRKDREGCYVLVNPEFCRLKGMKPEDFLGKTPREVADVEAAKQGDTGPATRYADSGVEHHKQILQTGKPVELVEEYESADGRKQFLHVIKLPVVDSDGKIVGTQGIQFDITERLLAEEALRESEEKFSTIFHNAPVLIAITDLADGIYLDMNAESLRVSGFTREEVMGRTATELGWIATTDGSRLLKELWEHGWVAGLEMTFQTKDGRKLCGLLHGEQISIGGRACLLTVTVDVTERKQAEEILAQERRLLRTLIDLLPETFYIKDLDSRFLVANEALAKQWGKENPSQLLGLSDLDLFPAEKAANYRAEDQKVFAGESVMSREGACVFADGREHLVLTTKVPYHDSQGRICGLVGFGFDITERKQAEQALRESEKKYRVLIETTATGFVIVDAQGLILDANDEYVRLTGYENQEQILGRNVVEWTAAHDRDRNAAEVKRCVANGSIRGLEVDYVRPDGTVVPIEINASTLGAGGDLKIVTLCRDITERKRSAQALVESEERLRITLETTKIGSWDWDVKKDFLYASPTYFTMLGYEPDPDHVDREQWLQRVHPDDRAATVAKIQEVLAGTSSGYQYEHRIKHADGSYRWHNVIGHTVVSDANGKPVRLMGVRMDITERKQAEQALAQSEATLRSLFLAAPVGIGILKNRVIQSMNAHWCESFGYPGESIVGQSARMFYASDEEYERVGQALYGKQQEQGAASVETKIRRSNGELRDVILTAAPLLAGDPASGNVLIVHDVTERKRAEDALRQREEMLKQSQQMARLGHYTFNAVSGNWTSSETLDEIFGIDADFKRDVAGWSKLIHPEDRDVMLAYMQDHVLKQHNLFDKEYRIVRANDGSLRWVRGMGELRFDASGEVGEMFGTIQDITERKQAEEALKQVNRTLQVMSESDHALVHAEDEIELMRQVCLTVVKLGGFRMAWVGLATADERRTVWPVAVAGHDEGYVQASEVSWADNERGRGPTGTAIRTGQTVANPDFLTNPMMAPWREAALQRGYACSLALPLKVGKSVLGALTIYADQLGTFGVQEVKLLEDLAGDLAFGLRTLRERQALRTSEAELRAILESTGDGILAVDRGGQKVIKANRRYAELWRIPQSIVDAGDNNNLRKFVLNQLSDPDTFLNRVHELYDSDKAAMDTLLFKDGRILERHGFPMMLDGMILGRVWSFRDITERKRQEKELQEKNLELERFTYTVSHDLKSPLVTVKTFLGYLERDMLTPDTERIKQDADYIRGAADKMGQLLDELLNLARVGRKVNPPTRVTFQQVAREAIGLVAGRISTSGAEVRVAETAVELEGDRPRLVEIWQNLVENACKFMGDQPQPLVEVGVEQRGAEMVFYVRDNGAGIDPRHRDRVFSLFEKLDPKGEGTGMGLALVKRVVELYQGQIWLESDGLGQGANFLFTLPAAVVIETGQSS